jgi:hypothetical protein
MAGILCAVLATVSCGGSVDTNPGDQDATNDDSSVSGDTGVIGGDSVVTTDSGSKTDGTGVDSSTIDAPIEDVPGPSADVACTSLAESYCKKLGDCFPLGLDVLFGDASTCQARAKAQCLRTLGAPGVHETPSMASACATDLLAESCPAVLGKDVTPSCVPAPGDVANGAACGDDEQCASGFCPVAGDAVCGTCAALPKVGDTCIAGACGRELACVSGVCQKPGKIGDSCDPKANPCETGVSCFGGKCVAGGGPGALCDSSEKLHPNCDITQGVGCNPGTHVCQKVLEAKAGDACGVDFAAGTYSICTAGSICRTTAGGFTGTCIAPAADGAECNTDPSVGPECLSPAKCVGTVCKLPDPASCK